STAAVSDEIPSSRTSSAWAAGGQSASVQVPSCMSGQATGTGGRNRPWPPAENGSGIPIVGASLQSRYLLVTGRPRLRARDHEARAADGAVAGQRAGAEAGPDIPVVPARRQPEAVTGPFPGLREARLVHGRPGGVDALLAPEQLHGVVGGTTDRSPAEDRVLRRQRREGQLLQRQNLRQAGDGDDVRGIPGLVERLHGVKVLRAEADLLIA